MKFIQNWYSDFQVAKLFAKEKRKELFVLSEKYNEINKPIFLKYIYNNTKNYLPVNSYSSFLIDRNSSFDIFHKIEEDLKKENATTAYIPIISPEDPLLILPSEYSKMYSNRLNSFYINLGNDLDILRKNISARKRSYINLKKFKAEFRVAEEKEKEYFYPLYKTFMESIDADKKNILSKKVIKDLINLKNNIIFLLSIKNKVILMHLIGTNPKNKNADFVLSASTKEGYSMGYTMIWNEICFLKSIGYKKFYLGGGIKRNDGVENFKKKIGGEKLYNGGIKLVLNKINYEKEFDNFLGIKENSFFPIYLRNQVLSNNR